MLEVEAGVLKGVGEFNNGLSDILNLFLGGYLICQLSTLDLSKVADLQRTVI